MISIREKIKSLFVSKINKDFIDAYEFPKIIEIRLKETYPDLDEENLKEVEVALRQFFLACAENKLKWSAMPSKVVDHAWHSFILETRDYQSFCEEAFGKFLHHSSSYPMKSQKKADTGIQKAWEGACKVEGIDPSLGFKLPLLFSIDRALQIPEGYYYVPNCEMPEYIGKPSYYCAGHIGRASGNASGAGCAADAGCGGGC